jgi:hypothetical protein
MAPFTGTCYARFRSRVFANLRPLQPVYRIANFLFLHNRYPEIHRRYKLSGYGVLICKASGGVFLIPVLCTLTWLPNLGIHVYILYVLQVSLSLYILSNLPISTLLHLWNTFPFL